MTTIVIDGCTQAVYTDTRMTSTHPKGAVNYVEGINKASVIGNFILAGTGSLDVIEQCIKSSEKWGVLELPSYSLKDDMDTNIVHVTRIEDGVRVNVYAPSGGYGGILHLLNGRSDKWEIVNTYTLTVTGFLALGSGGKYAFAAMVCGKTPEEAICVASKCDPYTNNNVDKYCFGGNV